MKKLLLFLSCILILSFFSCQNDDNTTIPANEDPPININFEENFGTSVTARFLGRVVNEQNEPIQGATIRIGNMVTSTDLFGIFSVSGATAYEKFAYITAEKDGYIIGSRALAPSPSEVNRVEIMLLKEDVIATISSGQQASVNLPNGTEVTFDGNFTKANGAVHTGEVKVILKHLSPDDENMDAMMPGMLFAQDASGDAVVLETYGMIAVELRSNAGEELQLTEGSTSQISMPLATNTVNPPATIPLWHFDEVAGYWVEEGQATLQGNKYVGDVSHFSFWNYDYPYPSIYLCIELEDENGNPMSYTPLDLYSSLLNSTGTYGYTNSNGVECGLVPSGEELTVIVPGVSCTGQPFTTTIGPFTSDTNITITVASQNQSTSTITGTFVTCDGNNVTDGYMQLFINGGSQIIPVSDGTINYTISYCGTLDYSIKGIDVTNNQVTTVTTGTLNGSATVDLGTLSSCTGFVDTDGDGIFDSFEDINGDNDLTNDDTDDDGIPNYQDADDDGDGINTADEDYDGDGDPTNDDTDGDQIPNYLDDQDVAVYPTEVPGEGCDPLTFNLNDIITNYFSGTGTNNLTYIFYENEADAMAGTNPISTPTYDVPLANVLNGTAELYIKGTSTITGQSAIAIIYLYYDFLDTDNDGLTDCEETTGVDNPNTNLTPNGTSDPNDPNDPYQQIDITINVSDVTVSEADGSASVNITLSGPSTVDTIISTGTVDQSAIAPNDYTTFNATLTIPAGATTISVSIPIVDDTLPEATENFLFVVGSVLSGNTLNDSAGGVITITDNDTAQYPITGEIVACTDPATGTALFDITSMSSYFSNGNNGFTFISYHATQQDAAAGTNALISPLELATTTAIFVRITDDTITLQQISTLFCNVDQTPIIPAGVSLTECDGNGDGYADFDLGQFVLSQVISNTQALEISFYETEADLNNPNALMLNSSSHTNLVVSGETIYYRIVDLITGCTSIGSFNIIVDSSC